MFKRVARRIRKKEEEEELGLNEEMKEVLGMHDTDSEESDSESEDDGESDGSHDENSQEGSDADSADIAPVAGRKRRRGERDEGSGSDEGSEDGSGGEVSDENLEPDEDENDSGNEAEIPISITEASKDPIYAIPRQPEVEGCAVCPGKLLKNPRMVSAHTQSNVRIPFESSYRFADLHAYQAHKRRYHKFLELAADAEPEDDVVDILRLISQPVAPSEPAAAPGLSKRAAKRVCELLSKDNLLDADKMNTAVSRKLNRHQSGINGCSTKS